MVACSSLFCYSVSSQVSCFIVAVKIFSNIEMLILSSLLLVSINMVSGQDDAGLLETALEVVGRATTSSSLVSLNMTGDET